MRVLIVDDAAAMRALLSRAAIQCGADVVGESATLEAAREIAARADPDVIIVDGRLANDIGSALGALERVAPRAALLVVASLEETALIKTAVAAGARGAIARPVIVSQVCAALASLLDSGDRRADA